MFNKKDYKKVGQTELRVSPITLGTMTFGDQNSQKEAFEQLDYALAQGINSFDVAEMYPVPPKPETCNATEIIIGNWLKDKKREELVISTKIAGPRRSIDWIRGGPKSLDEKNINEAVNNSLKRMKTDYIDLLYLHWPERNVPMFGQYKFEPEEDFINRKKIQWISIEEQLISLERLIKEGKVRFIALSNEYPWGVMEFLRIAKEKKLPIICTIQNSFSLINRIVELGLTEILFRENLGFFSYSPLGFGHLTGKYVLDSNAKGRINLFPGYAQRYNKPGVVIAVEDYLKLAKEFNLSLTQMALSFVFSQWFVTSTIVGATSMNQLKENLSAYKIGLEDDILEKIDSVHLKTMNPAP
ncbi:aldo/keto reductase [Nitrosomonadales bacterium]|nr:aldo/keto reductase [Nitrosomonadales bacterium]